MGNVLAASSPPAGPPPPPAPPLVGLPPPPPSPPGFTLPPLGGGLGAGAGTGRGSERTPGTAAASAGGTGDDGACGCLPNPGTFEECHRKCKELFPIQMEGVKLTVNKGLSNHFQVNHTVALSTIGESNYHFGVTYVGTKQLSPTEAFPVLVGDMDNSGSLNAQVIHQLGPGLRSKMAIQTQQSKFVNWQVDGEYRGSDFTAAVTLGNPDVLVGSGILVAHYLQSITPCLALGGELVYHRRPGEEGTVMSLAGKYTLNNWLATVTLGQAGMHATYYHKASDQLQVGVEFEASTRMQDTSVSFGYQLDLPKANLLFKGSVDSNWIVGATLEKKLPPLPLTLALGAFLLKGPGVNPSPSSSSRVTTVHLNSESPLERGKWAKRTPSWLRDSHFRLIVNFGLHAWVLSQWTLSYVPGIYGNNILTEKQTPWIKGLQDSYLDFPSPKRMY